MSNIITASFSNYYKAVTEPSWLIDHGMQLQISGIDLPSTFEAHFSNSKQVDAKRAIGTDGVVTIPDEYFLSGEAQIYCWIYLHPTEDSGVTEYEIVIPLRQRPGVDPSEPTPEQVDIVDQAIAALNVAMEATAQSETNAAASAAAALQSERNAATSEANALASERAAAQSEQNASGSAAAALQSERNAADSEANAAASATSAYNDAERAEQAAAESGYMFFYINENGDLIYQRTSNVNVDFFLYDGDLYVKAVS